MIRKQIYLERRQAGQLKLAAKMHGVSESELVRQAIDQRLAAGAKGLPTDHATWACAVAFMRALQAQGPIPNRRRDWTRDALYEATEN
jgi:hypothetical protein